VKDREYRLALAGWLFYIFIWAGLIEWLILTVKGY